MRHIPINTLLAKLFADDEGRKATKRLHRAHVKVAKMPPADRKKHTDKNGPNKWTPIKDKLTELLGNKCWYTEVEITGAPLTIDHFRPVSEYWWLAFDAENYRVSCSWANSPKHNLLYKRSGGKGDQFPLLPPGLRATGKNRLRVERPEILDPCKAEDCELLAFQEADGRPVLNPKFKGDAIAEMRVERSKILLNLDHPDFNAKRAELRLEIASDVRQHEALPVDSPERAVIRARVHKRLAIKSPFSTAAQFYLRLHQDLDWVKALLGSP